MKAEEWRKLKQIGSLCERLIEVIDESVELFIDQRPCLIKSAKASDPRYIPNIEKLEVRVRDNKTQYEVTERLLQEKIDERLEGGI